ncbi:GNAT family N-acetyltransferase [Agromyces atrinae]|uniref:GNAT family N-acetyltransferase n=1 Tax=Agromyces atrinae TaxID=592376 RepID=UPI001F560361|nr:GNAT family N-acetyltransferase [Agromyces atrinae]MCI2957844.1 GNAT family N-acetyltransferase [Agromyces atrinae]
MSALPPLSERVSVESELPPLAHDDVALWRPATTDDIDAIMLMQREADGVDHPDWVTAREDLADEFESSHIDMATESVLALGHDGRVVAFGHSAVGPGQETRVQSYAFGAVRPDMRGRGIGRQLLAWLSVRSRQRLAESSKTLPGWALVYAEEQNHALISLAQGLGYEIVRYFTKMERIVAEPIPEIEVPADIRIVRFDESLSESTRLARNDAFRDHWGSQPTVPERWAQFVGGEQFRADLSWVAVEETADGPRVVGLALTSINEEDWIAQGSSSGYVALIGVTRDRRGQRIAPACVTALLTSYREAGIERAILDVDTASPTGADGLYTRLGFTASTREVALVIEY